MEAAPFASSDRDPIPVAPPTPADFAFQTPTPAIRTEAPAERKQPSGVYFPMYDTMRLYAGWLLAWYGIVYAVGSYQYLNVLPFHVPYAESLFMSPLVLSFTFASYLFLLCTFIHTHFLKNRVAAILLTLMGLALFFGFRMNVQ